MLLVWWRWLIERVWLFGLRIRLSANITFAVPEGGIRPTPLRQDRGDVGETSPNDLKAISEFRYSLLAGGCVIGVTCHPSGLWYPGPERCSLYSST